MIRRTGLLAGVCGLVVGLSVAVGAAPAAADDISVTLVSDSINPADGLTSLREAFAQASASAGDDVINLVAGSDYVLSNCLPGELVDSGVGSITVQGNGASITQTCSDRRIINKTQAAGTLSLISVTLNGGPNSGVAVAGAGIFTNGALIMDQSTVTGVLNTSTSTVIEFVNTPALYDIVLLNSSVVNNQGRAIEEQRYWWRGP